MRVQAQLPNVKRSSSLSSSTSKGIIFCVTINLDQRDVVRRRRAGLLGLLASRQAESVDMGLSLRWKWRALVDSAGDDRILDHIGQSEHRRMASDRP